MSALHQHTASARRPGATGRSHGHSHDHAPKSFGRAFLIGICLNMGYVLVEAGYGFAAGSMALLADAGHNLSDVLGLLVAWGAAALTKRAPSERFTYGLRKSSILAALTNAVLLLVAIGAIAFEAIRRFSHAQPVSGTTVMIVAGIGIIINAVTALMFASGRKHDINIRGAYLHMAADAAVSAGVVVAGLIIWRTGWLWLDPAVSLAIVIVIMFGTWSLLRDSVMMALDAVPANIDAKAVEQTLASLAGVDTIHDLHIWPMSTTEVALTCHLVMKEGCPSDDLVQRAAELLKRSTISDTRPSRRKRHAIRNASKRRSTRSDRGRALAAKERVAAAAGVAVSSHLTRSIPLCEA